MKRFLHIAFWLALGLSSCRSHELSHQKRGQKVQMEVQYRSKPVSISELYPEGDSLSTRGLLGPELLLQGAQLAIDGVKELIKKSNEDYTHTYRSSLNNLQFYANNSSTGMLDPEGLTFRGFEVHRSIELPKKGPARAMSVYVSLDEERLSDLGHNAKFYLKLDSFALDYTGAKVNRRDWYLPWTLFVKKHEYLDLDIEIEITANWIDDGGTIHQNVPFGYFVLPLRKIPLSNSSPEKQLYQIEHKNELFSGSSYLIPRSSTYCRSSEGKSIPCYGRGDMNVLVKITESSRRSYVTKLLHEHADQLDDVKISEKDLQKLTLKTKK